MAKKINSFDPVKIDTDGKRAKRVVWSTRSLELALKGIEQGRKLIANPFYENNTKLLKGDLVFQRTEEEIEEWKRCRNNILYFAEKYCKLMTPEGIKHVKLRDYQKKYLKHLENTQLSIYLACRQCGKTTTSAIFILHYILFNTDKNALVLGNKRKTAVEILDKAKKIFLEIPFFLRPGVYKWNESSIILDNNCMCMSEATTINSGISFTFHCVLADEFAHIHPNILDSFYNNLFPTITAGKAKFIITSTQNGYNLFYRLYKAAEAGENDYKPFVTTWDQVPEWDPENHKWVKRDEEWHQKQVANYGSEEAFNRQFGTNFDVSADTLISQKVLSKRQPRLTEFVRKDLLGIPLADNFFWHPDYEPMNMLKNDYIITTADLSEGGGGDYTVLPITKMINPGTDDLETIGYFSSNKVKREDVAHAIQVLMCKYMNMEHSLLSFELNTYGDLFLRCLQDNVDKCRELMNFDLATIIKYYNDEMTKFKYGIKITGPNKKIGCMLFKESYERDEIRFNDTRFMTELTNFTNKGNGKYEAIFGHDDLVMATIQLEFVKQTVQYRLLRNEFNDTMSAQLKSNMYSLDDFFFNTQSSSHIDFTQQGSEMSDYYNIKQEINPNLSRLNKFNM